MFNNLHISILFSSFLCITANSFAETNTPIVNQKPPKECTDRENYDTVDCQRALELRQWTKGQEKVPDNKRLLIATEGEDVLVESVTGYRIGPHKVKVENHQKPSIAVKIGTPDATQIFVISGVCEIGNGIEVIKNTQNFTLFRKRCSSTDRRLKADDGGDLLYYYNFDKHYKRLDVVFQAVSQQFNEPTQTFSKGLYKLLWSNYNNGNNKFTMYFNYKITGPSGQDLVCIRSWDESAGCNFSRINALVPGTYKIIDK